MKKKLLGIIGGMGTQATACFYEKLHSLQNVKTEQEYLDILLYSIPSTPDRTAFITGQSPDSPLEHLINAAKTLESAGASCIAIPCITSHYFYSELADSVKIPVLNMLDETAGFTAKKGLKKVCLLATDGTIKGGAFNPAFKRFDINVDVPPKEVQSELMALIYNIKRGSAVLSDVYDTLDKIVNEALKTGAEAVVLGCTELCITADSPPHTINTLDVLAKASLAL